jgi:hypothetical protein
MSVSLTIKGLPVAVNEALDRAAAADRRSKNAQAIVWLEQRAQWQSARPDPASLRRQVDALARNFTVRISKAEHQTLVREGRA